MAEVSSAPRAQPAVRRQQWGLSLFGFGLPGLFQRYIAGKIHIKKCSGNVYVADRGNNRIQKFGP